MLIRIDLMSLELCQTSSDYVPYREVQFGLRELIGGRAGEERRNFEITFKRDNNIKHQETEKLRQNLYVFISLVIR